MNIFWDNKTYGITIHWLATYTIITFNNLSFFQILVKHILPNTFLAFMDSHIDLEKVDLEELMTHVIRNKNQSSYGRVRSCTCNISNDA